MIDYTKECTENDCIADSKNKTIRISHIIYDMGKEGVSLWSGFELSEEDEVAIQSITEKYSLQGCSVAGSEKDIAAELCHHVMINDMDASKRITKIAMRQVKNTLLALLDECNTARIKADSETKELYANMQRLYGLLISMIPDIPISEK